MISYLDEFSDVAVQSHNRCIKCHVLIIIAVVTSILSNGPVAAADICSLHICITIVSIN